MKVKELLEELKNVDPELDIVLQKDAEGNGYSPLAGADPNACYEAHTTYSGDVHDLNCSAEDMLMTEEQWEATKRLLPRVVVLHPVN